MSEKTGWIVSAYGFIIAHIPSASSLLIHVSIVVGLLQALVLVKKLGGKD